MYLKNTIEIQVQDIEHPVFEDYKKILLEINSLNAGDTSWFSTQISLNKENNTVYGNSDFTADPNHLLYYSESYSDIGDEKIVGYAYQISLENFLDVLKQYLECYKKRIEYIILYKDENKKMHCKEYFPTEEEKASNWKAIPNNHAK